MPPKGQWRDCGHDQGDNAGAQVDRVVGRDTEEFTVSVERDRLEHSGSKTRDVQVEGTMMIDPESARNLELVGNATGKKSPHSLFGQVQVISGEAW